LEVDVTGTDQTRLDAPARGAEAETLVVEGLRRWLAGYQSGSIECWEMAWTLYAGRLGVTRARHAVSGLSAFARALNGWAKCGLSILPYDCPHRCAHECLAVALVAVWQRGDREAATNIAEELVISGGLPFTLEAAANFADTLRRLDLVLPDNPCLACPHGQRLATHEASATRH
jgi:hypothetical protein